MCNNHTCPKASKCYRHKAAPNERWQSYSLFKPDDKGRCNHYLPIQDDEPIKVHEVLIALCSGEVWDDIMGDDKEDDE